MLRHLVFLAVMAVPGVASAQTPAELFQRVCVPYAIDRDDASATSALTTYGMRLVKEPEPYSSPTWVYAGGGYEVFLSTSEGDGMRFCSLWAPQGMPRDVLERAFVPILGLNGWTEDVNNSWVRMWSRELPPGRQGVPTNLGFELRNNGADGATRVSATINSR